MASTTPNIGLTLPVGTERVSRQIINENNTKLDQKIGPVGETDLQSQINSLNSNLRSLFVVAHGSGTVSNLAAGAAASIPLTVSIPSGYEVFMFGPVRTNGFVGGGYISSNTNAWVFNPSGATVSGTISADFLCIKSS